MSIYHKVNGQLVEFASKVSYDQSTNTLTINGEPKQIKSSIDSLYGNEGEVVYLSPTDIKKQSVLRSDIYICENQADENAVVADNISFKTIFDNWIRTGRYGSAIQGYTSYPKNIRTITEMFSNENGHSNALASYSQLISETPGKTWALYNYYWKNDSGVTSLVPTAECPNMYQTNQGYGSEYWVYNDRINSILQPMNCYDYSAFISPEKYTEYEMVVELCSSTTDNDYIGLVAAFNEDENGKPQQLNLMRVGGVDDKGLTAWADRSSVYSGRPASSKDNSWYTWYAETNSSISPNYTIHPNYVIGKEVKDDLKSESINKVDRKWATAGMTKIKVTRRGNGLTAWTTPFSYSGDTAYDNDAKLTVNLASVTTTDGTNYTCFSELSGGGRIGFITCSQPMTYYKIKSFKVPKIIIRIDTSEMKTYDIDDNVTITSGRFTDYVGIGRFIKNVVTNKTFYTSQSQFIKIGEY